MRRRRLKPMPQPPEGMMLYFGRIRAIGTVHADAARRMAKIDALPPKLRMLVKAFKLDAAELVKLAKEKGVDAVYADAIKKHGKLIVKARKRTGD